MPAYFPGDTDILASAPDKFKFASPLLVTQWHRARDKITDDLIAA